MPNILDEVIERLINIELKVNNFSTSNAGEGIKSGKELFTGHPDQWYGPNTFSQHGDDLIILNIFHKLGIKNPSYLDVGAHHPENISNTALLYKRGSTGINIEANPILHENFLSQRNRDINLNIGVGSKPGVMPFYMIDDWSGRNTFSKEVAEQFIAAHPEFKIRKTIMVEVKTLNQVVDQHCNGKFPDFLSIDVEGLDYEILKSCSFRSSFPKLICVEISSGDENDVSQDMRHMLRKHGFIEIFRAASNSFLIHESLHAEYVR
jgi:FkbM family methyltransferase